MRYLTYQEYLEIGGVLDSAAFDRNIDRVFCVVDNETNNRIEKMSVVPSKVKSLCRDLVEYFSENIYVGKVVSGFSQSAGGVSESESYVVKSKDEIEQEINGIIFDYLVSVCDDNGTPLLYRGCAR